MKVILGPYLGNAGQDVWFPDQSPGRTSHTTPSAMAGFLLPIALGVSSSSYAPLMTPEVTHEEPATAAFLHLASSVLHYFD